MMLRSWGAVVFLALVLPLTGCDHGSQGTRQEARQALQRLGILYSRAAFVERLRNGDPLAVDLFIAAGMDPDERDKAGVTPLMRLTMEGNLGAVQRLIAKGADINAADHTGATALMAAAGYGHTALVQLLIDKGAYVNTQASDGGTALMQGALNGHLAIVKLLLDHDADVQAKTKDGRTALSYAEDEGAGFLDGESRPEVVALLKQAGERSTHSDGPP